MSNPELTAYVQVFTNAMHPTEAIDSSGVLLDATTVLLSAHSLDDAHCRSTTAAGNFTRYCRFLPGSHTVRRGNGTSAYPFVDPNVRIPVRVSVHPLFRQIPDNTFVDVAVLKVAAYSAVSTLPLSSITTADLVGQKLEVTCYGYGLGTLTGGGNTLRSGNFKVEGFDPDFVAFRYNKTAGGVVQWRGDSGGPCLYNSERFTADARVSVTGRGWA